MEKDFGQNVLKLIGGIGILIAIFLFLSHGQETVRIIQTMARNSIEGIRVLQGR